MWRYTDVLNVKAMQQNGQKFVSVEINQTGEKVRTYMLIMTKEREIINLDNVLEIRANKRNVECELMNGYIYTIQSFKTHKKAEHALDKILKQYDRVQRVIEL